MAENGKNQTEENTSKNENKFWQRGRIIAIAIFVISAIATIIITWISEEFKYIFAPNIETNLIGSGIHDSVRLDKSDNYLNRYQKYEFCYFESRIENNSDDAATVDQIKVVVDEFIDYEKLKYSEEDIGGQGDAREPYYIDAVLDSGAVEATAIPWKKDTYLVVNAHDLEKVGLCLYPADRGYYKIHLEYEIKYHGKTRNIKTEPVEFLYLYFGEETIDKTDITHEEVEDEANEVPQFVKDFPFSVEKYMDIDQDGKNEYLMSFFNSDTITEGLENAILANNVEIYSTSNGDVVYLGCFMGPNKSNIAYNSERKCLQAYSVEEETAKYAFCSIENDKLIIKTLTVDLNTNQYYLQNDLAAEEQKITDEDAQEYIKSWQANNEYIIFDYVRNRW